MGSIADGMPSLEADSRAVDLPDAAATEALGARVGAALAIGDVVCLSGPLGVGKTTFARGAVQAWVGHPEETPSPTYTLVQTYDGPRGVLWHMDLYRLNAPEEAMELGLEEAFAAAACLVEWPERLGRFLPRDRLEIALAIAGEGRRAALTGVGGWRGRVHDI
ncbi:MAG: tRNA (adenosine(37)-N6)-threonylcarbamoyltransferase complex ATPase subunit type 1 TsaE [Hyphomonadaceae bacterium]|nr:tRNA (adenosine(37)-N6)-threonylcarbamoyltransferase complex ATPase subunit type 1 TsaE [Hyphomonadaceae bacterium]